MKYDIDMNSEFAEIFKKLENIILSYPNIKRIKNEHQTSYRDEYKTIVMLRSSNCQNSFVSSWGQGHKLKDMYPVLSGDGKIVRHLEFKNIKDIDEQIIRDMINESMILNMEDYELKQLKKGMKK